LTWDNRSEYLPEWSGDLYAMAVPLVPEYPNVIAIAAVMTFTITAIAFRTKVVRRRIKT